MFLKGDFHIHTTASDGKLSPEDVILKAVEAGTDVIAITDHDTVDGLESAIEAGIKNNLKVIPGVELSTIHNGESIHILGYFKGSAYKNPELREFLNMMKNYRSIRAKKIVENLDTCFGIKLDYDEIYRKAKGIIARPHLAQAIIDSGYTNDWNYIFENLLGEDSPAYVPNKKISIPEGIELLRSYNAVVVLAHPVLIKHTPLEEIIKYDFDGMEALYPLNSDEDTEKLMRLAAAKNKLITAGSDFHGIDGDDKHGSIGSLPLTGKFLNAFITKLEI